MIDLMRSNLKENWVILILLLMMNEKDGIMIHRFQELLFFKKGENNTVN